MKDQPVTPLAPNTRADFDMLMEGMLDKRCERVLDQRYEERITVHYREGVKVPNTEGEGGVQQRSEWRPKMRESSWSGFVDRAPCGGVGLFGRRI
jgi:hypothetical protein